jgi:hypothetical protein
MSRVSAALTVELRRRDPRQFRFSILERGVAGHAGGGRDPA